MRKMKYIASSIFILLITVSVVLAQGGSGDLKIGYNYIDEDGNRSISHSSFNYYDGAGISVENFNYRFKNGLTFKTDLRNINLDNRNLSLGLEQTGTFGVDINTNRYRRIYDFNGDSRTKRDLTAGKIWFNPSRYLKVYALGSFNSVSGSVTELFDPSLPAMSNDIDYDRSKYGVGVRMKYQGRMFQAEYKTASLTNNKDESKDQSRKRFNLFGHLPVPNYEWLTLSGSLGKFETKYDETGSKLEATIAKGSVMIELLKNLQVNYISYFTRAGSDNDLVKTDNLAHLVYASYYPPKRFGLTAGYQYDINDDFEDVVKASSYYLSGMLKPTDHVKLDAVYGMRAEEVDEGARLVGDEDRTRFKVQGKYSKPEKGSLKIGVESRNRKNDDLGSEADFTRYFAQMNRDGMKYFSLSGGYSYTKGEYDNMGTMFEYESHQVNADVTTREYMNFTGNCGIVYFRNKLDLDSESINLLFSGIYRFDEGLRAEAIYRIFNFDDFLFMDQYYTENIVEVNLIKSFSF